MMKADYADASGKKRVLCIAPRGQHLPLDSAIYDIVQIDSPALGLNRIGLEDFDLVVVDSRSAEVPVLGVLTDFLRRNRQRFVMVVESKPECAAAGLTSTQVNLPRLAEKVALMIPA